MLHGKTVHLTPTEYDILHDLVTHQGKVVRHRELLKAVWGDVYGDEREYLRVFQFFGSFLIFGADKFAS